MSRRGGHRPDLQHPDGTERALPSRASRTLLPAAGAFAFVLVFVFVAHYPGLHANALCFDDCEYLTDNPLVRSPGAASAWRFLREVLEPSTVHGYYQPLTMISLMGDYALGGRPDHLLAFHRTSLLLHLANVLLIMVLLYVLFRSVTAAAVAGLLFGVHPMTVETIVWIGERKTVLATFFVLLSILCYVRQANDSRRRVAFYLASLAFFGLALLAKPTVTPLPVCLVLLDIWPLRRICWRALLEKLPYLAVAVVSAIITIESQRRTAVAVMPGQANSVSLHYVICHNVVFYLSKMVWPTRMSSNYAFPVHLNMSNPRVAAGVVGTVLLITALAASLKWTRALAVGWLFFFVAIFPTLGVIGFTNVIAADKYAYWPALGILLIVAWLCSRLQSRSTKSGAVQGASFATVWILVGATMAAAALSVATRQYLRHWSTTEALSRHMVSLDGTAAAGLIHLALELDHQGRSAEAIPYFQRAAVAAPAYEGTFYNLGNVLRDVGRVDEALAAYRRAIELKPDFADAYTNMGNVLLARGDAQSAVAAYRRALATGKPRADTHYNLANVLLRTKDLDGAIEEYRKALSMAPDHPAAHKNLGGALLQQGDIPGAVEQYEAALRLQPNYWDVAFYLAGYYSETAEPSRRDPQRAIELAEHAVAVTGRRNIPALVALASALGRAGHPEQAHAVAAEALSLAESAGDPKMLSDLRAKLGEWLGAGPSQKAGGGQ